MVTDKNKANFKFHSNTQYNKDSRTAGILGPTVKRQDYKNILARNSSL